VVNVVCLGPADRRLLVARLLEHDNSHRRMRSALEEAAAERTTHRLDALRSIERRFRIDLASVCHRFERRDDPGTHPIERMIMNYIARPRGAEPDTSDLWVLLDRVAEIREFTEGRLVGEPGS